MKIDIFRLPPPLRFGEGDDQFALRLKRFNGVERMAILDACIERRFESIQAAAGAIVIGWEGVTDEAGVPLTFETMDENGHKVCQFNQFLGALPVARQAECLVGILAFIGLPKQDLQSICDAFSGFAGQRIDANPTSPPAGGTAESASKS